MNNRANPGKTFSKAISKIPRVNLIEGGGGGGVYWMEMEFEYRVYCLIGNAVFIVKLPDLSYSDVHFCEHFLL